MKDAYEYRLRIKKTTERDVCLFWEIIPKGDRHTIIIQALRLFIKTYPELLNFHPNWTDSEIDHSGITHKKVLPEHSRISSARKKKRTVNPQEKFEDQAFEKEKPEHIEEISEEDLEIMQGIANAFQPMNR